MNYQSGDSSRFEQAREQMVVEQLQRRGISDHSVLQAFRKVPREKFVPVEQRDQAYADRALAIADGQTISQPYMVGLMTELLAVDQGMKILEIGTGSGYQTAILAVLGADLYTVENSQKLAGQAKKRLTELGLIDRVNFKLADGSGGWSAVAPFDRIIVTAGAPQVPTPLKQQLRIGGKLVIPVGDRRSQKLMVVTKQGANDFSQQVTINCRFVPLIGEYGWPSE